MKVLKGTLVLSSLRIMAKKEEMRLFDVHFFVLLQNYLLRGFHKLFASEKVSATCRGGRGGPKLEKIAQADI